MVKKRQRRRSSSSCEVILSPLIDCVFLLLIFFLVTSMIKRFERQIPVALSDGTSAIEQEKFDESFTVGVSQEGILYGATDEVNEFGVVTYAPLKDPEGYLKGEKAVRGADAPIIMAVERGTPFQVVVEVQDQLEILGFTQVRFRIRDSSLAPGEKRSNRK